MAFPVLSTYRLQLRGASSGFGFTFADAENLLDYLDDLGVSHLYLSPILTPVSGSAHGYDVTDPTTVSAELGGPEGLARLSAAARARGMGLIVDIVPNHVGVDKPEQNPWWWDVLRHGRSSAYASFFDIDWDLGEGRIVLPLLGSDDDVADLAVDGDLLRLGDLALPIAPGTGDGSGSAGARPPALPAGGLAERSVRLSPLLLDHLAGRAAPGRPRGVRRQPRRGRPLVRRGTRRRRAHRPSRRIVRSFGVFGGLRELVGPDAWIVIEKILAVDEALEPTLPVAGTTGYDVLREVGGVFVDPTGSAGADRAGGIRRRRLRPAAGHAGRPQDLRRPPTRWPASCAGCGAASPRRPAPTIRCCPRRWPRCSPISTSTAATTSAWPRSCPPRWPKPNRRDRNWTFRCR